jgi:hypothetical protein
MRPFKLGAGFYILFTAIALIPATWIATALQFLLDSSTVPLLGSLARSRIIDAPTAVALVGIFFWVYEKYLWRITIFSVLHGMPYIGGRYEGTAESSHQNQKHSVVIEVHQTLTNVTVCLYTERSSSYSTIAAIGKNGNENRVLAYGYKNTPRTVTNDLDMRAHDGFASLEIFPTEKRLEGYYHNDPRDRSTYGKLSCSFSGAKTLGHF